MTEREALLRAVCENPDDDLPRLVFADWLDEHDEPERAEFIRAEIELDSQPGYPDDYGPEHDALNSKLNAYLDSWTWRRDLAICGDIEVTWARGFADTLFCDIQVWIASAVAVLNSHPLRKIAFRDHLHVAFLKLRYLPNRRVPWQLSIYQYDELSGSEADGWFQSWDKLVAACPEITAAWYQDYLDS